MNTKKRWRAPSTARHLVGCAASLWLAACGGGGETDSSAGSALDSAQAISGTTLAAASPLGAEGRLLASNCFQCHGTEGRGGFEQIRGKSFNELLEYQSKPAGSNIMAAHLKGYTPEQLRQIAAYLNR